MPKLRHWDAYFEIIDAGYLYWNTGCLYWLHWDIGYWMLILRHLTVGTYIETEDTVCLNWDRGDWMLIVRHWTLDAYIDAEDTGCLYRNTGSLHWDTTHWLKSWHWALGAYIENTGHWVALNILLSLKWTRNLWSNIFKIILSLTFVFIALPYYFLWTIASGDVIERYWSTSMPTMLRIHWSQLSQISLTIWPMHAIILEAVLRP